MDIAITPKKLDGSIFAIPSKSVAHRLLICAAFADAPSDIEVNRTNDDIEATVSCLNSMGADISYTDGIYHVVPVNRSHVLTDIEADCGESGSTLRFLLPVIGALGLNAKIKMHGRLPERPLSPLKELLVEKGMKINRQGDTLCCSGTLSGDTYKIDGGVSSQFISGLMFALPLIDGDSKIVITGNTESQNYIDMTYNALKAFDADIEKHENTFNIKSKKFKSPKKLSVEGDWSNGAFWLCASLISNKLDGKSKIAVKGLDLNSAQGDRSICDVIKSLGGTVQSEENLICTADRLSGCVTDARHIPDLVPVICAVASISEGKTTIINAKRLRLKESDRIESVYNALSALGAHIHTTDDGLVISGKDKLTGGTVDGSGDHRIVMTAAVASIACDNKVIIKGAQAVNKSYPDFWEDFKKLGGKFEILT